MVNLKPEDKTTQVPPSVNYHRFRFKHLVLFIFGSAMVHGLLLLILVRYETNKTVEEKTKSEPIDFIVVAPEEPQETPPETNLPAEPTTPPQEIDEPPAPEPLPEPAPEPTPPAATVPQPAPEPTPASEPQAQDLMTGSEQPAPEPEPEPQSPKTEAPVATRLPPESPAWGSAADLLGGDYQKTLANSGDAFFSPEALSFESVLTPEQMIALKDFDLKAYQRKAYNKVKRNWHPNRYTSEKYSTWVTFEIQLNGQITGLKIVQSSGSEEFDRAALDAIQKSMPLDPLPTDFPLESLPFKYQFYLY